ncbi:MAG: MBL fold metallo-hydrolase [Bacteroidetes bacterium]|nr:MBL fold metallo-hydrolase [Bacteroidota bacterium]
MTNIIKIIGAGVGSNCYIIENGIDAIIIDAGGEYETIINYLSGLSLKAILLTHGHYDHIFNVEKLRRKYKTQVYIHPADKILVKHAGFYSKIINGSEKIEIPSLDFFINDADTLDFKFVRIKVIHTPGHTEGGVCFYFDNNLFTGDVLMKNHLGRTDLPGGNKDKIKNSLKRITETFIDINIFPGHSENTTLVSEKNSNKELINIINT